MQHAGDRFLRELSRPWLRSLALRAARGKRHRPEVARFLLDLDRSVDLLALGLQDRSYAPQRGKAFMVRDPKQRYVHALPFPDRIAQHLLIDASLPALDRWFAPQSYACRAGKGTHRALERATELARRTAFVLCVDVRKFFPSIDHALLRALLLPRTPAGWRWLLDRFLVTSPGVEQVAFHFPGDDLFTPHERPHGLPIGSLTSQIWANAFLTPVDHLLGSGLGLGGFVRYCDDLLVFHDDPGRLREALARIEEHTTAIRLRLHPTKTRIHRTTDPFPCLGFVLRRRDDRVQVRLKHDNVVHFRRRLAHQIALFDAGALDADEVLASLRSWVAHARHGHTRALLARELERFVLVAREE
jgi:hypothetical protein